MRCYGASEDLDSRSSHHYIAAITSQSLTYYIVLVYATVTSKLHNYIIALNVALHLLVAQLYIVVIIRVVLRRE
jgi:hypothetical protein